MSFSFAQYPTPDMSFSFDSEFFIPEQKKHSYAEKLIELEDGSIIIGVNSNTKFAGKVDSTAFYFYKLDVNGKFDQSFGENGFLYFKYIPKKDSRIFDMVVLKGNMVSIVHWGGQNYLLAFTKSGQLMNEFGEDGVVKIQNGLHKLSKTPDGYIIVGGMNFSDNQSSQLLCRYDEFGQLDNTFGTGGKVSQHFGKYSYYFLKDIKCSKDGNIYVVGEDFNTQPATVGSVTKYFSDGQLATNYGQSGHAEILLEKGNVKLEAMEILQDHSVVFVGYLQFEGGSSPGSGTKPLLGKMNPKGQLDVSFGIDGIILCEVLSNGNDWFTNVLVTAENEIIAGGITAKPYPDLITRIFLRKYNVDGKVVSSFGTEGVYSFIMNGQWVKWSKDMIFTNEGLTLTTSGYFKNSNSFDVAFVKRLVVNETVTGTEQEKTIDMITYPNPCVDILHLKLPEGIQQVELYSLNGKLLFQQSKTTYINLRSFPAGMYILRVIDTKGRSTTRRVVRSNS